MNISFADLERALGKQGFAIAKKKFSTPYLANLFSVDTLIDVGVGRGTPPLHAPDIAKRFVLIDPQQIPAAVVSHIEGFGGEAICCQTALGDSPCELPFQLHANINHSNLLQHADTFARLESACTATSTTPVKRLDDLITELDLDLGRFGIKIDTEGYEKKTLLGATQTLENADFVIIEVSIKRRFKEHYKPSEIISIMSSAGHELMDIINISHATPWYIDMVFQPWRSSIFDAPK